MSRHRREESDGWQLTHVVCMYSIFECINIAQNIKNRFVRNLVCDFGVAQRQSDSLLVTIWIKFKNHWAHFHEILFILFIFLIVPFTKEQMFTFWERSRPDLDAELASGLVTPKLINRFFFLIKLYHNISSVTAAELRLIF